MTSRHRQVTVEIACRRDERIYYWFIVKVLSVSGIVFKLSTQKNAKFCIIYASRVTVLVGLFYLQGFCETKKDFGFAGYI